MREEWPIVADLRHMTATWQGGTWRVVVRALPKLLFYPRVRAVALFRLSHWVYKRRLLRPLAYAVQGWVIRDSGAEIHPAASIGPGFALIHSVGVVIGHDVTAGSGLAIHHGVTLGHDGRADGQPEVGRNVRIGAGAAVLGRIVLGDECRVGANAVVLADVPPGATVVGVWKEPQSNDAAHD